MIYARCLIYFVCDIIIYFSSSTVLCYVNMLSCFVELTDFIVPPQSQTALVGSTVSFQCVTGPSLPTPDTYWTRDGLRTSAGDQSEVTFGSYGQ